MKLVSTNRFTNYGKQVDLFTNLYEHGDFFIVVEGYNNGHYNVWLRLKSRENFQQMHVFGGVAESLEAIEQSIEENMDSYIANFRERYGTGIC